MNTKFSVSMVICLLFLQICTLNAQTQKPDTLWTLQKCIGYALEKNIQIRKSKLTNDVNSAYVKQANQSRFPDLNASVGQNFAWSRQQDIATGEYDNYSGSHGTSASLNSSIILFNGFKTENNIKLTRITYEAGKYNTETTKESVSLSILNAYLQVIYAGEQVKNSKKQAETTEEQLKIAEARLSLGSIAKSDYLQVKSQLASEKQTLASAEGLLAIDKVTLMQLLELPVTLNFEIYKPEFTSDIVRNRNTSSDSVYNIALSIKPQIKSAELNEAYSEINIKIARAGYLPSLLLSAGVNTGYSYPNYGSGFGTQFSNKISPSVGLTLSIPIYNRYQVHTQVDVASINSSQAQLDLQNTRNQLRKAIEQASVDVTSAGKEYDAGLEGYNATFEAYQVAQEKYTQGLINSVDFLIQKTNLITTESKLLQAKYNLIFSYKTLDFYAGIPLSL